MTENTAQKLTDTLELMNLVASALKDQAGEISSINDNVNSVGREAVDTRKQGENFSKLLDRNADTLDRILSKHEELLASNQTDRELLNKMLATSDKQTKNLSDVEQKITSYAQSVNDTHSETISKLNHAVANTNNGLSTVVNSLTDVNNNLAGLDNSQVLNDLQKMLAALSESLDRQEKQNKENEVAFNKSMDKAYDSLVSSINNINQTANKAEALSGSINDIENELKQINLRLDVICKSAGIDDKPEKPSEEKSEETK